MKRYTFLLLLLIFTNYQIKAHVELLYPTGGETFISGETVNIQWQVLVSHNTLNWDLYFSTNGGSTWDPIETNISTGTLNYMWVVPEIITEQAQIRIVQDNEGTDYDDICESFTISLSADISKISDDIKIYLYPNPASEKIIISGLESIDNVKVKIYTVLGELMGILILNDENEIDIKTLPIGVYSIHIRTDEAEFARKFIKK